MCLAVIGEAHSAAVLPRSMYYVGVEGNRWNKNDRCKVRNQIKGKGGKES